MEIVLWTYVLVGLIPINGLVLLGLLSENRKRRKLLMATWRLQNRLRLRRRN